MCEMKFCSHIIANVLQLCYIIVMKERLAEHNADIKRNPSRTALSRQ